MTFLPPPARDSDPKTLILSSAEPDAVVASLLVARQAAHPPRRIYTDESRLAEALAHPVAQRIEAGEVAVVGFAPLPGVAQRLGRFLDDRPRLGLRVFDDHYWPSDDLAILRRRLADEGRAIDPGAAFLVRLAWRTNGGDDVAERLVGLVDGSLPPDEAESWDAAWRRVLLALRGDPSAIPRATEPLLAGRFVAPPEELRALGDVVEEMVADLETNSYHRFPIAGAEGVLIVAPARPVWPFRELAAHVRSRTGARFSLACFDGEPTAFLEWGRAALGRPASETTAPPDAPALSEALRAVVRDDIRVRPWRRGEVVLDSGGAPFPPLVADLLPRLARVAAVF